MTTALVQAGGAAAVIAFLFAVVILALIHLSRWAEQRYAIEHAADQTYMTTTDISDEHAAEADWIDQRLMELAREREERAL